MPGSSYLKGKVIHLALPWVSLSVSLNIIVTTMICFRLLRMRALMGEVLDPEMSRMYTSIAAMLIESAAPFSILGIGFIVTAARDEQFVFAFAFVWSMFCVESKFPSVLTFVSTPKVNPTELYSAFVSVSLPANDHPPSRHGPCVAQRDGERDVHEACIRTACRGP
jgi:hypothetical protein